jgi:hypothetical protein
MCEIATGGKVSFDELDLAEIVVKEQEFIHIGTSSIL